MLYEFGAGFEKKTKAADKLHTGRSRNDQVATDNRLSKMHVRIYK